MHSRHLYPEQQHNTGGSFKSSYTQATWSRTARFSYRPKSNSGMAVIRSQGCRLVEGHLPLGSVR